jgi:REP element-mobilizing transposase RayT
MARPLRLEFAGALYHLTARGNARADIFADNEDRRLFLDLLGKEISQQRWRCYAYCLMDNHFHLLIETPEPNLVAGMRRLNGVYTQSFNRRHGRVGHVFQGRYKSIVVDKDSYGLELSRYVVLNPVRARRAKHPQNWPWSSYRATVGRVAAPSWLHADWVLSQLGGRNPAAAYERFVRQGIGEHSPWEKLRGQIWLGSEAFIERMQRRAVNLPLQEVAKRGKVSPSRISKIQRAIETGKVPLTLRQLLHKCKVKN